MRRPPADERRAGFEPATVRLCRPFPWAARAPTHGMRLKTTASRGPRNEPFALRTIRMRHSVCVQTPLRVRTHTHVRQDRSAAPLRTDRNRRAQLGKCLRAPPISTYFRHDFVILSHAECEKRITGASLPRGARDCLSVPEVYLRSFGADDEI